LVKIASKCRNFGLFKDFFSFFPDNTIFASFDPLPPDLPRIHPYNTTFPHNKNFPSHGNYAGEKHLLPFPYNPFPFSLREGIRGRTFSFLFPVLKLILNCFKIKPSDEFFPLSAIIVFENNFR
jgi:hypothetical protein